MGSLRRIDRRLLPHSLHARQDKGGGDAVSELTDMLMACTSASEAAALSQERTKVTVSRPFSAAFWDMGLVVLALASMAIARSFNWVPLLDLHPQSRRQAFQSCCCVALYRRL